MKTKHRHVWINEISFFPEVITHPELTDAFKSFAERILQSREGDEYDRGYQDGYDDATNGL